MIDCRAAGALREPLQRAERRGQHFLAATGDLGGGRWRCASRVTNSWRSSRSREPAGKLSFQFAFDASRNVGEPGEKERMTSVAQVAFDTGVTARRRGLALQRTHLAAHFAHEVAEPFEVLLGLEQSALGPLLATSVLSGRRPPLQ
jgi:hypothetical protein